MSSAESRQNHLPPLGERRWPIDVGATGRSPLRVTCCLPSNASHFLYSCLINPDASISCTKLESTNVLGSAAAALGFFGAMSSSNVLMPAESAYGTSRSTAL